MAVANGNSKIRVREGCRVIFFGDSITELGEAADGYVSLIRNTIQRNHPKVNIEIIGAGISGNRVIDLQQRVDKDVVQKRPTLVVIFIGINDVWIGEDDPALATPPDEFKTRLEQLAASIVASGAEVVVCTPTVIGEKKIGTNPLDDQLEVLSQIVKKIAKQNNYVICDLREGFAKYLAAHNRENLASGVLTYDGVHLSSTGNMLVSKLMLDTLGERQT